MFEGYFAIGDTEIINAARLTAYTANGVAPPTLVVNPCVGACPDLNTAVFDKPYTTPLVDDPPWADVGNSDSYDFAGIMPLGFTGLDGSTRTVEVLDRLQDGGIPQRGRRGPRTIGASALLVARSEGGLVAGMEWLTAALHPPCAVGTLCGGSTLHAFSQCPPVCVGQVDPTAEMETIDLLDAILWPGATAAPSGIVFTDPSGVNNGLLLGEVRPPVCDQVLLSWTVQSTTANTWDVAAIATTVGGRVLVAEGPQPVGQTPVTITLDMPMTPNNPEDWRPGLFIEDGAEVLVTAVTITHRPILTTEECVAPIRRTYRNVVTAAGPTVVQRYITNDQQNTMARVEWTWIAGDPYVWQDDVVLLTGVSGTTSTPPDYQRPGINLTAMAPKTAAETNCPRPIPSAVACNDDPCCPGLILPPTAPIVVDPCVQVPTGYYRRTFEIPSSQAVAGVAALSFTLVNDAKPKLGVRIRVYNSTEAGAPADQCDFDAEINVSYIGPNETLFIDGPNYAATVTCTSGAGDVRLVDAGRQVRGPWDGPFRIPTVGCGLGTFVSVDIPSTYTKSCTDAQGTHYTAGQPQGDLAWSAILNRREG